MWEAARILGVGAEHPAVGMVRQVTFSQTDPWDIGDPAADTPTRPVGRVTDTLGMQLQRERLAQAQADRMTGADGG